MGVVLWFPWNIKEHWTHPLWSHFLENFSKPVGLARPPRRLSDHLHRYDVHRKWRQAFWKADKTRKIAHLHPLEPVASGWTWNQRVNRGHPRQPERSPNTKQCRSTPRAQLTDEREGGVTESVCGAEGVWVIGWGKDRGERERTGPPEFRWRQRQWIVLDLHWKILKPER